MNELFIIHRVKEEMKKNTLFRDYLYSPYT